jgi:threonine synthase
MKNYLKELECSRCYAKYSAEALHNLCGCGGPLLARYNLTNIGREVSRDQLQSRPHSMWRFRELLPINDESNIITLGEGFTPLVPSVVLRERLGLTNLCFKDESFNPTGSFKARGLCVAVSKAKELGAKAVALPTAGNAGSAAAAYSSRGGIGCYVFMPRDTPLIFEEECRVFGADVQMVNGYITDAGNEMRKALTEHGWFEVSTFREPYRLEGKKTILFEVAQQLGWRLPDVILFPTGGGTGIVAAHKAYQELSELGWLVDSKIPRLIAVQAAGCAPIVRAWENGLHSATEWEEPYTHASGLRVPKTIGDALILRAIRETNGMAVAVDEQSIREWRLALGSSEGINAAPEAAAAVAALPVLLNRRAIQPQESILILLTGSGLKYPI